ncbi:MAG: GNAT family N-acetyltransferase [candidate division Zixibacteria bacterium]|nr:GNAT family N-acetyltransferase [candidate division Zixibacteria bacterium]
MIFELEPGRFYEVAHLFRGHKQYLPVFAIIDRNFPGRIFVDEKDCPSTALVWAIGRWAYVDGDALSRSFTDSLAKLIKEAIIPSSLQIGMNWFELYTADSTDWKAAIRESLDEFKPEKHHETVFTFDKGRYLASRRSPALPEGSRIERAEFPILPDAACDAPFIPEEFKTKTCFGYRLVKHNKVISVCRSNGLMSGREFMIDIYTSEENQRRKGYATAVGAALIDYCLQRGFVPLWETTQDNIPSRKVAHKLGFVENESYPVYAMEF